MPFYRVTGRVAFDFLIDLNADNESDASDIVRSFTSVDTLSSGDEDEVTVTAVQELDKEEQK